MPKFEHACFETPRLNVEEFEVTLSTYGDQGWELVSVILTNNQKYMLFFKRPMIGGQAATKVKN